MKSIAQVGFLAAACIAGAGASPHGHEHQRLHRHAVGGSASAASYPTSSVDTTCTEEATATNTASPSQAPYPSCWTSCFAKYHPTEQELCSNNIGSSVKSCINTACKNSPDAIKRYNSWIVNYCPKTASGTGSVTSVATSVASPTSTYPATYPVSYNTWTSSSAYVSGTLTSYSTVLITETVTAGPTTTGGWGYGNGYPAAPSAECGADVTVTTKVYETVTVTAGGNENYWGGSAPETWAYPSATGSPEGYTPPAQQSPTSPVASPSPYTGSPAASSPYTGSPAAPSPYTGSPAAPSPYTTSPAAPPPYTSAGHGQQPTSPAAPAPSPSHTGSGKAPPVSSAGFGKRGLAYNVAADTEAFVSTGKFGWAYNWGSLPQGIDTSSVTYIPMLWSNGAEFVGWWGDNVQTNLDNGAEWFFSFNEPDMPSQANMSPQEAASAWMQYLEPYAGQVKLVAPAVTNGIGSGIGIDWLMQFLEACSECTISAVNQHWYDSAGNDVAYFQQQISEVASKTGLPVFVSEFAGIGDDTELVDFMSSVVSWMDTQDNILGYSYYMVGDGYLNAGTGLSPLGQAYVNAS